MFKYNEKVSVNCNVEKIYSIVADIEKYPNFIPWCSKATYLKEDADGFHHYKLDASFGVFNKSFTTKDKFTHHSKIEIYLVEGPFKHLKSIWNFNKIDEQTTEVEFNIEFDFKNPFIGSMFGNVFLDANKKVLQAFLEKAKQ